MSVASGSANPPGRRPSEEFAIILIEFARQPGEARFGQLSSCYDVLHRRIRRGRSGKVGVGKSEFTIRNGIIRCGSIFNLDPIFRTRF